MNQHNKQLSPMQELIDWINENKQNFQTKDMGWETLTKATELLTSSKVVTTEEVYRWVKASERTPVKDLSPLVIRMNRGFLTTAVFNGKYFELQNGHDNTKYDRNYFGLIEWMEFDEEYK